MVTRKPTLLIAERDSDLCDLYQRMLIHHGCGVITAEDGLDCLAKLRVLGPDALVLDLELPWGGGDGVLEWLRDETAAGRIPVVLTGTVEALAAIADQLDPREAVLLSKPFTLTALLSALFRSSVLAKEARRTMDWQRGARRALSASRHGVTQKKGIGDERVLA